MGVPYCFAWLKKKNKVSIIKRSEFDKEIDILYFDWNCLLHPQCFKVLGLNIDLEDEEKLIRLMFNRIIEYTNYVIRFVCPKKYVFFAIDGVAPLAKIRQQRQRRFGYANDYRKNIMDKFKIKYNNWSNVVITPGTEFMDKLHKKVINYYSNEKNRKEYCDKHFNPDLKVLYSSYHTPGEGEHKILQDLKNRYNENNKENIAIYGLDADLIFLAMSSNRNNIYLVREESEISNKRNEDADNIAENLLYVDMDDTMNNLNNGIKSKILDYLDDENVKLTSELSKTIDSLNYINDYILICYLLGNDFLPHFYSLDLRRGGMEIIIENYVKNLIKNNFNLMVEKKDKININNKIFIDFIKFLSDSEFDFLKNKLHHLIYIEKNRTRCFEKEPYKIEIWKKENLIGEKIEDKILLGKGDKEDWKERYYKYIGSEENREEYINKLSENYLQGIIWTANYYMDKCIDWRWQFNFTHPPLMMDFYKYLENNFLDEKNFNKIEFLNRESLPIFVQLTSVLPPKFNYLLPKNYRYLSTSEDSAVIDMFPIEYKVDKIYKSKLYQCVPIIPNLNIERILNEIEDLKLTSFEKMISKSSNELFEF